MSFIYKNPLSSSQFDASGSVQRQKVFGTNFSVLQVGGYMEVYTLDDLKFTIPEGDTGLIEFTGNTIPINYSKRTLGFLPDNLTLNSDNISSGRRRLGMLVYVHETNLTYQYTITNYDNLWNAASGSTTESDYSTTISTSTTGGTAFIDAWLDSSIEGVSGVTRSNARWRIFYGTDITVTGGTYNSGTGTLTMTNTTGGTFNITGFTTGGGSDTYVTGGTFSSDTLTLDRNDGNNVNVTGFTSINTNIANSNLTLDQSRTLSLNANDLRFIGGSAETLQFTSSDLILSAATGGGTISFKGISSSSENRVLVINTNGVLSYNDNISDVYVTGGTYNNSTGTLTLERNDTNTFNITGFTTGTTEDTYVTGTSYNQLNKTLTIGLNDGVEFTATGFSPTITGGTYSSGEISLDNNDGTSTTIGGLEILTHIGYSATTSVSTSGQTIDTVDTSTYQGAFFDYVINDGTNYRAGTVQSVWDGTSISYNDFSTVDIGNTVNFTWAMELSGGDALLKANIAGGTWNIRIIKHII